MKHHLSSMVILLLALGVTLSNSGTRRVPQDHARSQSAIDADTVVPGVKWRELSYATDKNLRKVSFVDNQTGWVGGWNGTIMKTTDGGSSWQSQNSGTLNDIHELFMLNRNLGWALSYKLVVDTLTGLGTELLKTTDGGVGWEVTLFPDKFYNALLFLDSLNGIIGGEAGSILRTTDGGINWTPAEVDTSSPPLFWGGAIHKFRFMTPTYGYAIGGRSDFGGSVWRTTNGGVRWTAKTVSPDPMWDIHYIDSLNILAVGGYWPYGPSTVKTTNGGSTWDYTWLYLDFGEPSTLAFRTDEEAWAPLGFAGYFMTTSDTGRSWSLVETPHLRTISDMVFTDSLTGYAVGDSGMILKYSPGTSSLLSGSLNIPDAPSLRQNYPNPFNPTTTIEFTVPRRSHVSLSVVNILGQEVAILVNDELQAGTYTRRFDAENLASGIYFYQLQAGTFTETSKDAASTIGYHLVRSTTPKESS